jgi:hypothetical protein
MGLFSDSKKVYVSSVAYNLAGDVADRPNILGTTLVYLTLGARTDRGLGYDVVHTLVDGPYADQRKFFSWAKERFSIGKLSGGIDDLRRVPDKVVKGEIPIETGNQIDLSYAIMDSADIIHWAKRWVLEHRPEDYDSSWIVDTDEIAETMIIEFGPGDSVIVAWDALPVPYVPDEDYIVAYYSELPPDEEVSISVGTQFSDQASYPTVAGYELEDSGVRGSQVLSLSHLETTTITPPGLVGNQQTYPSYVFERKWEVWEKETFITEDEVNDRLVYERKVLDIDYRYQIDEEYSSSSETVDGVTTTIEITKDVVTPLWDHQETTSTIYRYESLALRKVFIYQVGSGNDVLDALRGKGGNETEYFPIIPLRIKNKRIDASKFDDIYPKCKRAYKLTTGQNMKGALDTIEDNEGIDDIDFAYLVHGVALNTTEKPGLRYIYQYLSNLIPYQNTTAAEFAEFEAELEVYKIRQERYQEWLDGTRSKKPTVPSVTIPDMSKLNLSTSRDSEFFRYRTSLHWMNIDEEFHNGVAKKPSGNSAKKGDIFWTVKPNITAPITDFRTIQGLSGVGELKLNRVVLTWQHEDDTYRTMTVVGMYHLNHVYKAKAVKITSRSAINDNDESGFILPLHYKSLKEISLHHFVQLAHSSRYIVFNAYDIVVTKWYQTGLFRILISIVVSVAVALINPAAAGLLGANIAVGTALGLSGTAAIIAGAVANAVAALALSYLISWGANAIFGETIGPIIAAIVTFVAFQAAASFFQTGSIALNMADLFSPQNLLKLTDAVAGAIQGWARGEINDINVRTGTLTEKYEDQMDEIEKRTAELLGYSGIVLDPLMIAQVLDNRLIKPESSESFLHRTLLTGSDIAEASVGVIGDFSRITLDLPDYTT